jgi:hypothetical protein
MSNVCKKCGHAGNLQFHDETHCAQVMAARKAKAEAAVQLPAASSTAPLASDLETLVQTLVTALDKQTKLLEKMQKSLNSISGGIESLYANAKKTRGGY